MNFDKILIPLDGSRFAEAALPKAVELVRNNPDATLILLRATEATTFPGVALIMMSTHGRSGIGRLIAGSVAESVLRGTRTPIFLVRVEGTPAETPVKRAAERQRETANV